MQVAAGAKALEWVGCLMVEKVAVVGVVEKVGTPPTAGGEGGDKVSAKRRQLAENLRSTTLIVIKNTKVQKYQIPIQNTKI